jgi:pimeloyl-ACP methyl ester carboxylesterase
MSISRSVFEHNGLRLSYLDSGEEGRPLIALHGHFMEGSTFASLATELAPEWRVIALDQRGHGQSDHAKGYARSDYISDMEGLYRHLGLAQAVILGSSLGGVNAYQFAARYPERVIALIIEDIDAEVADDISFALAWEGTFDTREELVKRVGPRFAPYLMDSFRETAAGWKLAFEPKEMVVPQDLLNGGHWEDWLASDCPALLIRGRESRVTTAEQVAEMAQRRANTTLVTLDGGHILHVENPVGFTAAIKGFLKHLESPRN